MRGSAFPFLLLCMSCSISIDIDRLSDGNSPCSDDCAQEPVPGSVGGGIVVPWDALPKREIVGGSVDGDRLVVAVRVHGQGIQGAILSIALDTGDREILFGAIEDVYSTEHVGSWGVLKDVRSLSRLASGAWGSHLWTGFDFKGSTVSIDPVTGKSGSGMPVGGNCPAVAGDTFWPDKLNSIVDIDGATFMSVGRTDQQGGRGVARVTDVFCEMTDLTPKGPFLLSAQPDGVWYVDESTAAIGRLPRGSATSQPMVEGSAGGKVRAFAMDPTHAYLFRDPRSLETVELKGGSRTSVTLSLSDEQLPQKPPDLFPNPASGTVLFESDGRIFAVDPATGSATLLSY